MQKRKKAKLIDALKGGLKKAIEGASASAQQSDKRAKTGTRKKREKCGEC